MRHVRSPDSFGLEAISTTPETETESIVLSGAKQGRPLLVLCVAALVGFIGWQILTSNSRGVEGGAVENAGTDESDEDRDDAISMGVSVASPSPNPVFPLFPNSPGLTVAFVNPAGEVLLIDADDGSLMMLPESVSGQGDPEVHPAVPVLGRVGDTLVVSGLGNPNGYPLNGNARIDFGESDDVILSRDLIVLLDYPETMHDPVRFRAFAPNGDSTDDWVSSPDRQIGMNRFGLLPVEQDTFAFTGDGFEQVATRPVVAAGQNHLVEVRCDSGLFCTYHRIDRDTGESQQVPIIATEMWWQLNGLSPDGRWMNSVEWDDGSDAVEVFTDLETGQTASRRGGIPEEGKTTTVWDPMSRYGVTVDEDGRTLHVFDTQSRKSRTIDGRTLGIDFHFGSVVVVGPQCFVAKRKCPGR